MKDPAKPTWPWPRTFLPLFLAFLLQFVFSGFWMRVPGALLPAFLLAFTLASGLTWARWGSGSLRLPPLKRLGWFLPILVLMAVMDARALNAPVPWMGDEDFHILLPWTIAERIAAHPAMLTACLLPIACAWLPARRPRLVWGAALAMGLGVAAAGYFLRPDAYQMLRNPVLVKFLTAFPVFAYSSLLPAANPELPYRLLPWLSAAGIAWVVLRGLGRRAPMLGLGSALLILSLPLVRYYSTILYLEMPAVLGMTVACLNARSLLTRPLARLVESPAWYALLLIGFVKETTMPFLAAFLLSRWMGRLPALIGKARAAAREGQTAGGAWPWEEAWDEARIAACVGFPLFFYLVYRSALGDPRPFILNTGNLSDPTLPPRLARSLWDCFGILLFPAAAGAVLLAVRRKRILLSFYLSAMFLNAAMHFLDLPRYVGYSRFNLFLLPSLIALSLESLRFARLRFPVPAIAILALAVAADIRMSPINADGTKKPYWGVYGEDCGEHYYPYRDALRWIAANHPGQKALLTGNDYLYRARFYPEGRALDQLLVNPKDTGAVTLDTLLARSSREGYRVVLYHLRGGQPALRDAHGFGPPRVFRNQAHALLVFDR